MGACVPSGAERCHAELPRGCVGAVPAGRGREEGWSPPRTHPPRVPAPTCLLLHVIPQQVAAGEVLHAEVLDNPSGDGAFPGARRPHDDGAQQWPHHHAVPAVPAVRAAPAAGAQGRGRSAAGAPPSRGAPPRPAGRPGPVLPGHGSGSFSGCQSGAGRKDPLRKCTGGGRDKFLTIIKR